MAVDGAGSAPLTGRTSSTAATLPDTQGVFKPAKAGDHDAFVSKLDPTGAHLIYATFLGGTGHDVGRDIAVGWAGNV